ncbi:MAG: metallophosphoesterase [Verrucomicrobiota bacterium]
MMHPSSGIVESAMDSTLKQPVRILSDLHLAHQVSRIARVSDLRPLVAGAGTVIFNGDTWQELTIAVTKRSAEMLEELRHLCAEEGCATVFLPGNHDPSWPGPGWVELAGGRIIVTHGDALMPDGSPWKREVLANRQRVLDLWSNYPLATTDAVQRLCLARAIARALPTQEKPFGRRLWQQVRDAVYPPQRALRILQAWWTQAAAGADFCKCYFPQAEVLVVGHFHRHGCWRKAGRLIINTGSFMHPGRALWVEWNDGWLRRGMIDEAPDGCRLGKVLNAWLL